MNQSRKRAMIGNIVIAFHMFQVRGNKNLKNSDNYIGPPMTTVIDIKSNHGPKKHLHDPR